jgi:hypothetical protein
VRANGRKALAFFGLGFAVMAAAGGRAAILGLGAGFLFAGIFFLIQSRRGPGG